MRETIDLESMRYFAMVASANGITAAAKRWHIPKQTISRRVAELERQLGVQLLHRTTRRVRLSDAGVAYAERCAEIVRLADDANAAIADSLETPNGVLRITAHPVFGDAFLEELVIAYARDWPAVKIEVALSQSVDLANDRFDVAFGIGHFPVSGLVTTSFGPARPRYCASPEYLRQHAPLDTPDDLRDHDCLLNYSVGEFARWLFKDRDRQVTGRLRLGNFSMLYAATLAGLGIAVLPEFSCSEDLRNGNLVSVLDAWVTDEKVDISMTYRTRQYLVPRVRVFVDMVQKRLEHAPWRLPAT